MLPLNDQLFDFIAYYPYSTKVTDFTIPIDIIKQEPRADINIMYSTSVGHTYENSSVEFKFKRVLSSIVIHLSSKEGINLQDATITIANANTSAILNLVDGLISVGQDTNDVTPYIEYIADKNELIAIASLMPEQDLSNLEISIQLENGNNYSWTPEEYILSPEVTRSYQLILDNDEIELINIGSTIEEWEYDLDETIHNLKPTDPIEGGGTGDAGLEDGDGTKQNPYTVSQAISAQGVTGWVEGYIIGYYDSGLSKFIFDDFSDNLALQNIVIVDDILDTDERSFFTIKISDVDQSIGAALNLKDNGYLHHQKIKIHCNFRKFSDDLPGGRQVIEYEIITQ